LASRRHGAAFLRQPGDEDLRVDVRKDTRGQFLVRQRADNAMPVIGTGPWVRNAPRMAGERARNVVAPEPRGRGDIGNRFLMRKRGAAY
jgi:hypothetical protein